MSDPAERRIVPHDRKLCSSCGAALRDDDERKATIMPELSARPRGYEVQEPRYRMVRPISRRDK